MSTTEMDDLFVFTGQANHPLAQKICDYLHIPLRETNHNRLSNDNLWVQLGESVRGKDVYIIQSLSKPVSDHLMQLLMMINIARMGDARRVSAVIPYFSYARSDKKDAPRVCITARMVADLIETAGADRVISMMLHSAQVHGFFGIPLDHLTSQSVFVEYFAKYRGTDTVLISPDVGYAKEITHLARALSLPVGIGNKQRLGDANVRIDAILGSGTIAERAIIIDDEIATGSSMIKAMEVLRNQGTKEFVLACTHGVLTNDAAHTLSQIKDVEEIVVTDTVLIPDDTQALNKIKILSLANVLGEAISRNHRGESMGSLFTFWPDDDD